jgi:hypothetical protein
VGSDYPAIQPEWHQMLSSILMVAPNVSIQPEDIITFFSVNQTTSNVSIQPDDITKCCIHPDNTKC